MRTVSLQVFAVPMGNTGVSYLLRDCRKEKLMAGWAVSDQGPVLIIDKGCSSLQGDCRVITSGLQATHSMTL